MLLDELMPRYDVAAQYETLVDARPERTFAILQHVNFSQSGVIRSLMGLRTLGRRAHKPDPNQNLTERMRQAGFMEVARRENEEIVIGVVGRFWQPRSGIIQGLSPKLLTRLRFPLKLVSRFLVPGHGVTSCSTGV